MPFSARRAILEGYGIDCKIIELGVKLPTTNPNPHVSLSDPAPRKQINEIFPRAPLPDHIPVDRVEEWTRWGTAMSWQRHWLEASGDLSSWRATITAGIEIARQAVAEVACNAEGSLIPIAVFWIDGNLAPQPGRIPRPSRPS